MPGFLGAFSGRSSSATARLSKDGIAEFMRRCVQREDFLKHEAEICALLAAGADPNASVWVKWQTFETTALFEASVNGDTPLVRALLAAGANAGTRVGPSGYTAAYNTALEGHTSVLQCLVHHDPDAVLIPTSAGFSPLYIAAQNGRQDCLDVLLNSPKMTSAIANATPAELGGASALYIASQAGHDECVEVLLDWGAKVDVVMLDGSTPLMVALYMARRAADLL